MVSRLLTLKIMLLGWQRHKRNLAVILDDEKLAKPLNSLAEVVWCRDVADGETEVGVKFINIPANDYQALIKMFTLTPPS